MSLPYALRKIRKFRGLSQDDFSKISSRTYLSALERGIKNPTLSKIDELCVVLGVHPLTLLTLTYLGNDGEAYNLLSQVEREISEIFRLGEQHYEKK